MAESFLQKPTDVLKQELKCQRETVSGLPSGFYLRQAITAPGLLRWLVDENVYYETQQWWSLGAGQSEPYAYPAPFDKPFYILLNLALGGNYDGGVAPEDYSLPAQMLVDYVRVYDKDQPYATNVKRPVPERDENSFKGFETSDGKNFIFDSQLTQAVSDPGNAGMLSNEKDPTARLEFNFGLDTNDVWIGNVSVTQEEL